LGLVARRPTHGYALVEQIRRWPLDPALVPSGSSIYKALRRLCHEQSIEPLDSLLDGGADRLGRTTYGATAAGEQRFAAWLQCPPTTYEDLCMRIGAARPQDLPMLIEFVSSAEHVCLARLQGLRMPEVESLVARGAPWEVISTVLLGRTEAAEVAGRSKVLRDLRRTLETLQRHDAGQGS
jgi:DNA-binding PadR family transcriptional regulator